MCHLSEDPGRTAPRVMGCHLMGGCARGHGGQGMQDTSTQGLRVKMNGHDELLDVLITGESWTTGQPAFL